LRKFIFTIKRGDGTVFAEQEITSDDSKDNKSNTFLIDKQQTPSNRRGLLRRSVHSSIILRSFLPLYAVLVHRDILE
jgi:hypothetical protein